jgi:hypothetical protein
MRSSRNITSYEQRRLLDEWNDYGLNLSLPINKEDIVCGTLEVHDFYSSGKTYILSFTRRANMYEYKLFTWDGDIINLTSTVLNDLLVTLKTKAHRGSHNDFNVAIPGTELSVVDIVRLCKLHFPDKDIEVINDNIIVFKQIHELTHFQKIMMQRREQLNINIEEH